MGSGSSPVSGTYEGRMVIFEHGFETSETCTLATFAEQQLCPICQMGNPVNTSNSGLPAE
jgi:hypothetical protein